MFLTGSAAAGAIALINSVGNLRGFVGPYIVGSTKDVSGGFSVRLNVLAAFALAASAVALIAVRAGIASPISRYSATTPILGQESPAS